MEENAINTIMQFISNLGFPIAAFCLMWHTCQTALKENTKAIGELRDEIARLGK